MMTYESNPNEGSSNQTPFDEIIARVKSYVKDPTLATKDTLSQLLSDLEDLKSVVDDTESPEEDKTEGGEEGDKSAPGIMIMLSKHNPKEGM